MKITLSASYGKRLLKAAAKEKHPYWEDFVGKYFMIEHDNLNFLLGRAQVCFFLVFLCLFPVQS